jgi:anti-sigma factor RsiW
MLCGRVTNLLSAYIDRELAGAEMLQVREHLGACETCRAEHAELGEMKSLLGRVPAPPPRSDFVAATMHCWQEAREPAPRPRLWALRWFLPILQVGQSTRVALLATCLAVALVATGAALRQPSSSDAVVAGLPRAGVEEWPVRPWERAVVNSAIRSGAASEEQWLLLSLARPAGVPEDSAVGLVREIAHRQPIGLSWALD